MSEWQPVCRPVGDSGLLVVLGDEIGPAAHARVVRLEAALAVQSIAGVIESVPAYATLMVIYDPLVISYDVLVAIVAESAALCLTARDTPFVPGTTWRIPVCYGDEAGEDLSALARRLDIAPGALVAAHASAVYTVYMLGFLPGFAYLGGLPAGLATPRRQTPRQRVPRGSVAIGGAQTAIWPIEGPCGWHVIGRTPCRTFERGDTPGSFLGIGDRIVFEPVGAAVFAELELAAVRGARIARPVA